LTLQGLVRVRQGHSLQAPAVILGPVTWGTPGMLPLHAVARALAQPACEQPGCSFSCYEVNLRGCLLQDLLVSFSRPPGSREEESFICRLGEIQVCMWEKGWMGGCLGP
jgi:hypothetical protein